MAHIFITGVAGFIGMHLARHLLTLGHSVIGVDNLNHYYDIRLKHQRLAQLETYPNFQFFQKDILDKGSIKSVFAYHEFDYVIHLAAQAGVRYSMQNPDTYIQSNLIGFMNLLEILRYHVPKNFIFASSSSVYGNSNQMPLATTDPTDSPISLYAATKKANEVLAHSYAHLYNIPTTGLRFFTVYGPWGRPDMSYFKFTENILNRHPITVFHEGHLWRDFTYIDDIISGIIGLVNAPPESYALYNIGNHQPENVMDMVHILEELLGEKAIINHKPLPAGDVLKTYADISALQEKTGFTPQTSLRDGLEKFVDWYLHNLIF